MSITLRAKRILTGALAGAMVLGLLPAGVASAATTACQGAASGTFTDSNPTHQANIDCIAAYDVVSGFANGTFGGSQNITRGQMATFIAGFAATTLNVDITDIEVASHTFTDVAGNVHADNIARIFGLNVTAGRTATTFAPNDTITRAEAATMLANAHVALGVDLSGVTPSTAFTDLGTSVHADNINLLAGAGVVSGKTATTFAPSASILRAEVATLLVRSITVLRSQNIWAAPPLVEAETNQTFTVTAGLQILPQNGDRVYTANVGSASQVAVALVKPDEITIENGVVSFADATDDKTADLDEATDVEMTVTTGVGADETNIANATVAFAVVGGVVTIEVSTTGGNSDARAIPVVYVPTDGNLAVDEDGVPTADFGIGGEVIFTDLGGLVVDLATVRPYNTEVTAVFTLEDDHGVVPLAGAQVTLWVERNESNTWDGTIDAEATGTNPIFDPVDADDVIVDGQLLTINADGEASFTWTGPVAPASLVPGEPAASTYDHIAVAFFSFGEFEDVNVDAKATIEWSAEAPEVADGDATFGDVELLAISGTQRVNTVTVVDQFDRPVAGATVVFTASDRIVEGDGTVADVTATRTTNSAGVATWNRNYSVDAQETISAQITAVPTGTTIDGGAASLDVVTVDADGDPTTDEEYTLTWYVVYDPTADDAAEIDEATLVGINTTGGYVIVETDTNEFFGVFYTSAVFFEGTTGYVTQAVWVADIEKRLEDGTPSEISTTGYTDSDVPNEIEVANPL